MPSKSLFAVFLLSSALGAACTHRVVYVATAPPPPVREHISVAPGPGYVWVAGHHRWEGHAYVWVPGHWVRTHHHHWVEGHWAHDHHGWYWVEGHWA